MTIRGPAWRTASLPSIARTAISTASLPCITGKSLGAAMMLALSTGCSAGLGGPASSRSARDGVIRFTFAPDPIWDYMHDTGIVEQWQRDTGYTIETSATWDEFGLFAGEEGFEFALVVVSVSHSANLARIFANA